MLSKLRFTFSHLLLLLLATNSFAAPYSMQTGYFPGDGQDNRAITGLGFQPNLVIIKDDTNNGTDGILMRTSAMAGDISLPMSEAEGTIADNVQSLDADGFTIGTDTDVNASNVGFFWAAFGGSDCSATGTFCVGSYTGNGTGGTSITSVGFQPNLVIIKRAGATAGIWKSSDMTGNNCNYIGATAQLTTNVGIRSLDATGFTIGTDAAVNTNTNTYYYIAFKEISGQMDVGTYAGNSTDARDIVVAATTFKPNFVFVKSTTAADLVASMTEHNGDRSLLASDSNSAANHIQLMNVDGFEVGTTANTNTTGNTYFYAAFGGATAPIGTGTFTMATGTYTGTGASLGITGVGFSPTLVIVKNIAAQHSVFKTVLMMGDRTSYLANAATFFTGGITSIDADGFTVGTNATTNTLSNTYYWTAFGNGMRPDKSGGAADFYVGQYLASGVDSTNIEKLPFQPDLVAIKRAGASAGTWRTSNQAGDASLFFGATASAADYIQAINSDGFQKGANASVNTAGNLYDFFMFKDGDGFTTGTYTGDGTDPTDVTSAGFSSDYLWAKKTTGGTAREGVMRMSRHTGDAALPFGATANTTGAVKSITYNGYTAGTSNLTNENTFTYQYAAWNTKQYTQEAYRLFMNTDTTDVGPPFAALNTPGYLSSAYDRFRLRMLVRVDEGHLDTNAGGFKLQFVDKGVGTCAAPSGGTPSTYIDVTSITGIRFFNNATPTDGSALTSNASDPTDGVRTIDDQSYEESHNIVNTQAATLDGEDSLWDLSLVDGGSESVRTYCFKLVNADDDSDIDTYTNYPEVTVQPRSRRVIATNQ